MRPNFELEDKAEKKGYHDIGGIDEAGRGPLAGPVVAACVILPSDRCILGLNDSKKLTAKKRQIFYEYIMKYATVGIGMRDNNFIDKWNILAATKRSMEDAVLAMNPKPDYLLVDGPITIYANTDQEQVIKGDTVSMSIAAASIVAKVTRDRIMQKLHDFLPIYGFDKHSGYGTKFHKAMIALYGVSPFHRKTFSGVKEYIELENYVN
jgi:ribonuclease HII